MHGNWYSRCTVAMNIELFRHFIRCSCKFTFRYLFILYASTLLLYIFIIYLWNSFTIVLTPLYEFTWEKYWNRHVKCELFLKKLHAEFGQFFSVEIAPDFASEILNWNSLTGMPFKFSLEGGLYKYLYVKTFVFFTVLSNGCRAVEIITRNVDPNYSYLECWITRLQTLANWLSYQWVFCLWVWF